MAKTKSRTKTRKNFKGGFLGYNETQDNSLLNMTNIWNTVSESAKNIWNKAKQSLSPTENQSKYNIYGNTGITSNNIGTIGGKKRKNTKGGYGPNISLTNIASQAESTTQPTANPQVWLTGGKSRKNYGNKYKKLSKSKRSKK